MLAQPIPCNCVPRARRSGRRRLQPGNVVVDGTDSVVEKTLAGVDVPRVDQRDRLDDPMLGRSDRQNVALYQLLKKPSIRVGTLALAFGDPSQASGQAGQVVLINHLLP